MYTCTAENQFGSVRLSAFITVTGIGLYLALTTRSFLLGVIATQEQFRLCLQYTFSHIGLLVCPSVVCHILVKFCTYDGFSYHLAGILLEFNDLCGLLKFQIKENWGWKPQPKHAVANYSQTVSPLLPPCEYKREIRWTTIPHNDSAFCQITSVP